jgi:hypothetical protein
MRKLNLSTLCRDWDANFHSSVREKVSRFSPVPGIASEECDTSKKAVLHKTLPYYLNKSFQVILAIKRKDKSTTQLMKQPRWCSLWPLSLLFLGKHFPRNNKDKGYKLHHVGCFINWMMMHGSTNIYKKYNSFCWAKKKNTSKEFRPKLILF